MAYELKKDEEQGGTLLGTEGTPIAAQQATISGTGQQTAAAPTGGPSTPSNFTNINQYLAQNRPQTASLAQKAGELVRGDIGKAQTALGTTEAKINEAIKQGTNALDQNVYNQAWMATYGNPNDYKPINVTTKNLGGGSTPNTPPAPPKPPAGSTVIPEINITGEFKKPELTPDLISSFQKMYGGEYKGPQSLETFLETNGNNLKKVVEAGQRTAGLVNTEQGRQELLARLKGGARVSKGALTLDQALLQRDPEAYKKLQETSASGSDLQNRLAALSTLSTENIAKALNTSKETAAKLKADFNASAVDKDLQERALAQQAATDTENAIWQKQQLDKLGASWSIPSQITTENPLAGIANGLMLTGPAPKPIVTNLEKFYGIDPTKYMHSLINGAEYSPSQITKENVARQADYDKLQALAMLTGEDLQGTLGSYNPKVLGQGYDVQRKFDNDAFLSAVNAARPANAPAYQYQEQAPSGPGTLANLASVGVLGPLALVPSIQKPTANVISNVGSSAGNWVSNTFNKWCFDGDTPVTLGDVVKKIKDINVGDGNVTAVYSHETNEPIFNYFGVMVTGEHAVKENGKFIRVKDSKNAVQVPTPENKIVYNLDTLDHRIYVNGIEFADNQETAGDLSLEESLAKLNEV